MKTINVFISKNLDYENMITNNPPKMKNFRIRSMLYILNLINQIPANNKDIAKKSEANDGYVPISTTLLRKDGIYNYKGYIDYLLQNKIIETDNHYIPGQKSRGFRFTEEYCTKPKLVRIEFETKFTQNRYFEQDWDMMYLPELYQWIDHEKLQIDFEASCKYISEQLISSRNINLHKAILKHNSRFVNIVKLHDRDRIFFCDETGLRLHTNLTFLQKDLRKFLTFNGHRLCAVDIVNSEPFLSIALFSPQFYSTDQDARFSFLSFLDISSFSDSTFSFYKYELSNTNTNTNTNTNSYKKLSFFSISSFSIMLSKYLQKAHIQGRNEFVYDVVNGRLYENYRDVYNKTSGKPTINRSQAKIIIMKIFYSANRHFKSEKQIFNTLYPGVEKVFQILKSTDHRLLSTLLMRMESFLVIQVVCKKISELHMDLPIFTIHDSIVTIEGKEQIVKDILQTEIEKYVGRKPMVKIEKWI